MGTELKPNKPTTEMNTEEIIGWLINNRRLTVLRSALKPQTATELCEEVYNYITAHYDNFISFCDPLITLLPYSNAERVYKFMLTDDCKDGCIAVIDALTMYLFTQLYGVHPYYLMVMRSSSQFRLGNIIVHFDRDRKSYWIERV